MKQSELARQLGTTRQALNDVVHGRKPGTKYLARIAEILEVDLDWLLYGGVMPSGVRALAMDDGGLAADRRYYENAMSTAEEKWRMCFHVDPQRAQALAGELAPEVRERLGVGHLRTQAWDYEETLSLLEPWDLPETSKRITFRRGFHLVRMLAARSSTNCTTSGLTDLAFEVTMTSLRQSRSQVAAFGGSTQAIDQAFREQWQQWARAHAASGVPSVVAEQMKADIGAAETDRILSSLLVPDSAVPEAKPYDDEAAT